MVTAKNIGKSLLLLQGLDFIKYFDDLCPNHGKQNFVQIFDNAPECVICQQARLARQDKERELATLNEIKQGAMRACNIDPAKDLTAWQFDDTQLDRQQKLIANLTQYANNFNQQSPNILLIGSTGTGKTHICNGLAKIVFNHLYDPKKPIAKVIKTAEITRQVKDGWGDKSKPTEHDILTALAKLDFLVLDDLGDADCGNGETGANDRLRFGQLIDARYQKAPTVITTNLNLGAVKAFLGDRAWDRFSQNMIVIECNWQSYRQRTRQVAQW